MQQFMVVVSLSAWQRMRTLPELPSRNSDLCRAARALDSVSRAIHKQERHDPEQVMHKLEAAGMPAHWMAELRAMAAAEDGAK
jgi:hypothetical protein